MQQRIFAVVAYAGALPPDECQARALIHLHNHFKKSVVRQELTLRTTKNFRHNPEAELDDPLHVLVALLPASCAQRKHACVCHPRAVDCVPTDAITKLRDQVQA